MGWGLLSGHAFFRHRFRLQIKARSALARVMSPNTTIIGNDRQFAHPTGSTCKMEGTALELIENVEEDRHKSVHVPWYLGTCGHMLAIVGTRPSNTNPVKAVHERMRARFIYCWRKKIFAIVFHLYGFQVFRFEDSFVALMSMTKFHSGTHSR